MTEHYYLDTNALIKYSCYQNYKVEPEYGVEDIRELINNKKGIFYLSHLTLWEFYHVLLERYRDNAETIFGSTAAERHNKFMRVISEVIESIKDEKFRMDNTAISTEVFLKSQKLMFEYGFNQKRALDSIDALHIALVQSLISKYETNVTIICADKKMTKFCKEEGMTILFIQKPNNESISQNL
jgi:predicted nucleic acid-binding protein